jgi:hypothetical protein
MSAAYTNIPPQKTSGTSGQKAFVNFFTDSIEVDATVLDAMTGFFTGKGFNKVAASSFSSMLIAQAKKDNSNPLQLLDVLKGYDSVQINSLMAEVINYNRFKTSYLGFGPIFSPNPQVTRNILP